MPEVTVTVNGRDHLIGCGDGEEDRVRELAAFVEKRASDLVAEGARVPDSRLMLMTALMIADELAQAYDDLENAGGAPKQEPAPDPRIAEIAERLEKLADGVDSSD